MTVWQRILVTLKYSSGHFPKELSIPNHLRLPKENGLGTRVLLLRWATGSLTSRGSFEKAYAIGCFAIAVLNLSCLKHKHRGLFPRM